MKKLRTARPIRCPRTRLVRLGCHRYHGCVRELHLIRFVTKGCRCYRRVQRRREKCCCPRPRTSVRCKRPCGRLIRKTVYSKLVKGRCVQRVRRDARRTVCYGPMWTTRHGRCINGRQKVEVKWTVRVGCRCVRKRAIRIMLCACPKDRVKDSGCRAGCIRIISITSFKRYAYGGCKPRHRTIKRLCCCPRKGRVIHKCRHHRYIRITISWAFDRHRHTCVRRINTADVTHTIPCGPRRQLMKSKCRYDGSMTIVKVIRQLRYCRCQVHKHKILRRCRCPKPLRVTRCVANDVIQTKTAYYFLQHYRCSWRVKVQRRRIRCPHSQRVVNHCNRQTCVKTINVIRYKAMHCRCVRTIRQHTRKCCCPKHHMISYSHCKKNSLKVFEKRWKEFDPFRGTCVSRARQLVRQIICPKSPRIHTGPCAIRKGKTIYRVISTSAWHVVQCQCYRYFRKRTQACGCVKGYSRKGCEHGIVFTHTVRYVLGKTGVCSRRDSRRRHHRIVCRSTPRRRPGPCSIVGADGHKYRLVKIAWQQRVGCSCYWRHTQVKQLCGCRGPLVRRVCRHGGRLRVLVRHHFVNVGGRCRLRVVRLRRAVRCPSPQKALGKCVYGSRRVTIRVFQHTKACGCVARVLQRKVPCGKCPSGSVVFEVPRRGACLGLDRRFHRRFHLTTLRHVTYWTCRHKCELWQSCRSFDFYQTKTSGVCVLSSETRKSLAARLGHKLYAAGAYGNLRRYGAIKCIHTGKVCRRKCKGVHVTPISACRCLKHVSGHPAHCLQKSKVVYYRSDSRGQCKARVWVGQTPCAERQCDNLDKEDVCVVKRHKGLCRHPGVFRRCKRSCSQCQCRGFHRSRTECNPKGYRRVFAVHYRRHAGHGRCVVKYRSWVARCAYCVGGRRTVVQACHKGRRVIEVVQAKKDLYGKCVLRRTRHVVSCAKCSIPDRKVIGSCRVGPHGKKTRKIEIIYFVRRKSCCHMQRTVRVVECGGCPDNKVKTSGCFAGVRLRRIFYFIRFKRFCFRHTWTRQEKCHGDKFGCKDKLGPTECALMKMKGLCKYPDAKKLCRRKCNLC